MKVISTYREVTLTGKRKYELDSDNVVINGSGSWSYEFEQKLQLKKISPDYAKLRITMFLLTGFASILLIREFAIQSTAIPGVLGIFSVSALIVALATFRKVEYARFCSDDYGSILFNVARSGPDRNQFDSFVKALVIQIGHAKQLDQESAADQE
jgi:hypothetical protein